MQRWRTRYVDVERQRTQGGANRHAQLRAKPLCYVRSTRCLIATHRSCSCTPIVSRLLWAEECGWTRTRKSSGYVYGSARSLTLSKRCQDELDGAQSARNMPLPPSRAPRDQWQLALLVNSCRLGAAYSYHVGRSAVSSRVEDYVEDDLMCG
jgi:hypothetical protein